MNPRRLFIASCISLITSAFTFVVRGDVLQQMGDQFAMSQTEKGSLEGAVFLGMAASMLIGGFICDVLGMKKIMFLAFFSHLIGVTATVGANFLFGKEGTLVTMGLIGSGSVLAFWWLFSASFLMGCGNGMVETGINPLAATLYPTKKTHVLNILHAWWPGGLVLGGLLARFVGKGIDLGFVNINGLGWAWWQSIALILVPCLIYGAMLIGQKFPVTERVAAGVSTGDMMREAFRAAFLLWAFCMLLTAATELGPQKWQESVMQRTAHVSGTLILVYTSGMMFILRHFAGPLAHAMSPVGMLTVSALLSAVGLYLLSTAETAATAFTYATIFGLGIAYFWPTMLGVTAERFPKGGALLLCLMGCVGNLSISQVLPRMGGIYDHYSVQALQQKNPHLAERLVTKDGAINQDLAKKFTLLVSLTDEQKAAIDPKTWVSSQQAQKLEQSPANFRAADLSLEQWMVWQALEANKGKDPLQAPPSYKDSTNTTIQELYLQARGLHLAVVTLQQFQAAQLTPEQKNQLAKELRESGQAVVADRLLSSTFNPDELTTEQRNALNAVLGHLTLLPAQQQLVKEQGEIADAEKIGAAMAFRWVTILPAILVVIFGVIAFIDWSRGGYKAVHITDGLAKGKDDGLHGAHAHAGGREEEITGVRKDI
jgi:MFS family permease